MQMQKQYDVLLVLLVFGLIGLLVLLWAVQHPFPLTTDEVGYLVFPCERPWAIPIQWGPGYKAFYCVITALVPNALVALYVKSALVLLLLLTVLFAILRTLQVRLVLALAICVGLALTLLPLQGTNSTSESAFLLAICGALLVMRSGATGWSLFFVLLLVAFFMRTEYALALFAGILVLLPQAVQEHRQASGYRLRLAWMYGLVCLCLCAGLYMWGPKPIVDRSWIAFGQHFARNLQNAYHLPGDSFTEWNRFVRPSFPTSQTLPSAALENPAMFAWHVGYNLLWRLPEYTVRRLTPTVFWLPVASWHLLLRQAMTVLILVTAVAGCWSWQCHTKALRQTMLPLLLLLPISLVSLVVMPVAKHLLPLLPILAVMLGWGIEYCWQQRRIWLRGLPLLLGLCLFLGLAGQTLTMGRNLFSTQPSVESMVAAIQQQASAESPVRILSSASWGQRLCALAQTPYCTGLTLPIDESPSAYARQERVTWILADPGWQQRVPIQEDPVMGQITQHAEAFGCHADPVTRQGYHLIRCDPFFQPDM